MFRMYLLKDFEVGKVYKKKVQLTNVSYTMNHCRLVGVSEHLKDFISIMLVSDIYTIGLLYLLL